MATNQRRRFKAVLEPLRTGMGWVIARIPFDAKAAWPAMKGRRVRGEAGGIAFRTSLFPDAGGDGHFIVINKKMQKAAGVGVGGRIALTLEPDVEERAAVVPEELAAALKGDRRLRRFFDGLNYSTRKGIGDFVGQPKSVASREKRAEAMAERLLLTLEGEKETPPILEMGFQREPMARMGWGAMTPAQRRHHLMGIFYYQRVEARQRRTEEALRDAVRIARKGLEGRG